uniref:Uncharacterized protein n=1 Tax=Rhinolophus ferrumequinum TaxID=59479 RepID=A0A671FGG5_RHIFE
MPPHTELFFRNSRYAPQIPGRRPHPVLPVPCHPAPPALLPHAVWEGPAGGGPDGLVNEGVGDV